MSQEIVFIGSSHIGLYSLLESSHFKVLEVFCLANRLTNPLSSLIGKHGLPLKIFSDTKEFRWFVERHSSTMPFFIYQLDMLVPADLCGRYCFYNVHRGNLRTNRGPNPDVWPILNGDTETSLSLHRINDKVDSGILIDSFAISISPDDDTLSLRSRLEKGLPLLIESLYDHLKGVRSGTVLVNGIYRPWVKESDFTINLLTDSVSVISQKIRSQRQYNGAIILNDGVKYYVVDILESAIRASNTKFFFIAENGAIQTCSISHALTFKRNMNPQCPPPPIRPPSKRL